MVSEIHCPGCGRLLKVDLKPAARRVKCKCGEIVPVPPMPAGVQDARGSAQYEPLRSVFRQLDSGHLSTVQVAILSVLGAGLAVGVTASLWSIWISQNYPIFGGLEKLGEPWSPARMSLIPIHAVTFAIGGFVAGSAMAGVVVALIHYRPKDAGN